MVSAMAIGREVFGSCVGEIDVLAEIVNRGIWLCCEWSYFRFIWVSKGAQNLCWRWEMVPGIGGRFGALGNIEETKSPCGGRGLGML
jgi:hypothetical protein